jgi:hypothetical protein
MKTFDELSDEQKAKVVRPGSKEEMAALAEGDLLIEPKLGLLLYTEQHGPPRMIRQHSFSETLSVTLNEWERSDYGVEGNGEVTVHRGETINVLGNQGWIQYSLDQSLITAAGLD